MRRLAFKRTDSGEVVEIFAEEYGTYVVSISKDKSSLKAVSNSFELAERLYRLFAYTPLLPRDYTDGGLIEKTATHDRE